MMNCVTYDSGSGGERLQHAGVVNDDNVAALMWRHHLNSFSQHHPAAATMSLPPLDYHQYYQQQQQQQHLGYNLMYGTKSEQHHNDHHSINTQRSSYMPDNLSSPQSAAEDCSPSLQRDTSSAARNVMTSYPASSYWHPSMASLPLYNMLHHQQQQQLGQGQGHGDGGVVNFSSSISSSHSSHASSGYGSNGASRHVSTSLPLTTSSSSTGTSSLGGGQSHQLMQRTAVATRHHDNFGLLSLAYANNSSSSGGAHSHQSSLVSSASSFAHYNNTAALSVTSPLAAAVAPQLTKMSPALDSSAVTNIDYQSSSSKTKNGKMKMNSTSPSTSLTTSHVAMTSLPGANSASGSREADLQRQLSSGATIFPWMLSQGKVSLYNCV
jgi:hypothetical protein